jgi:hypothetical protein
MGIVNDVTYTSMKNRNTKFFVLWATQKWQNQIWRFENIHTQIHMFVIFYVAQHTKYLKLIFGTFVG